MLKVYVLGSCAKKNIVNNPSSGPGVTFILIFDNLLKYIVILLLSNPLILLYSEFLISRITWPGISNFPYNLKSLAQSIEFSLTGVVFEESNSPLDK